MLTTLGLGEDDYVVGMCGEAVQTRLKGAGKSFLSLLPGYCSLMVSVSMFCEIRCLHVSMFLKIDWFSFSISRTRTRAASATTTKTSTPGTMKMATT